MLFAQCREALDSHYDVRERAFRMSRDVTQASKNVIFSLHRADPSDQSSAIETAEKTLCEITAQLAKIFCLMTPPEWLRYRFSYAPSLQEYIEAACFLRFLKDGGIPPLEELDDSLRRSVAGLLPAETTTTSPPFAAPRFLISLEDYFFGVADVSGEVMRFATNAASRGMLETVSRSADFARRLLAAFVRLPCRHLKGFTEKVDTMSESVRKMEKMESALLLRQAEFPDEATRGLSLSLFGGDDRGVSTEDS